jgi:hypothetical protein
MQNSIKFCLVILLLTLFQQVVQAQEIVWPRHHRIKNGRAPIKEGFIVLAKGDILKGSIMLLTNGSDAYPILVTATKLVREIALPYIASMRIYDDKPGGSYFDYINFPYTWYLWRLDGRKRHVAIYDDQLRGGNHFHMILASPTNRITVYKSTAWPFYNSKLNGILIRFVNQRYKTGVQEGDFKSTKEIIDYILDKEEALCCQ